MAGLAFLTHYRVPPLVDYNWQESSRCIGKETTCVIPINPPGWKIIIDKQMKRFSKITP
jgi:hypothetical protein